MSVRIAVALLMVSLLAGCEVTTTATPAPPAPSSPRPADPPAADTRTTAELISATVQLAMFSRNAAGDLEPIGSGSGTILTSDGLILTNAHVAGGDTPGLAVQYTDISPRDHVDELVVLVNEQEDRPPVARYKATVAAIDGYLDLAVVRVTSNLDNSPVSNLNLPFVPLGNSDTTRIGDEVSIVGFPGVGGSTVSVDEGQVSGFLDDPKLGVRGWIKHGALQSGGNSGGLLADERGHIVGVPSRSQKVLSAFGNARPIKWALTLIDAAIEDRTYTPFELVQLPADAAVDDLSWSTDETCQPTSRVTSYASGVSAVRLTFSWDNFPSGLDVIRIWLRDTPTEAPEIVSSRHFEWDQAESGECFMMTLPESAGLPDGDYLVAMYAGPTMTRIFSRSVSVGGEGDPGPGPGPTDGFQLAGRITDASTGLGINGATVTILKPGSDAQAFLNDQLANVGLVIALGRTDATGAYTLDRKIVAGQYPLIVRAAGYRTDAYTLTVTGDGNIDPISMSSLGST